VTKKGRIRKANKRRGPSPVGVVYVVVTKRGRALFENAKAMGEWIDELRDKSIPYSIFTCNVNWRKMEEFPPPGTHYFQPDILHTLATIGEEHSEWNRWHTLPCQTCGRRRSKWTSDFDTHVFKDGDEWVVPKGR